MIIDTKFEMTARDAGFEPMRVWVEHADGASTVLKRRWARIRVDVRGKRHAYRVSESEVRNTLWSKALANMATA